MSEYMDIESEIESRIVKGLRTLMTLDSKYTVDAEDQSKSKVLITGSKPREENMTVPHIYIDNIGYRVSDVGLNQGYNSDIINEEGKAVEKKVFRVDYSVLLVSMSKSRPVAKNVANRVIDWIWVKGRDFFDLKLGVKINSARKSQGNRFRASENKEMFSENVSIEGYMLLDVSISEIDLSGILETIIMNYTLET